MAGLSPFYPGKLPPSINPGWLACRAHLIHSEISFDLVGLRRVMLKPKCIHSDQLTALILSQSPIPPFADFTLTPALFRRNVGYASTCNAVGQTAGYFLGNVVFLALESPDFCNRYLRSSPSPQGVVTLAGGLYSCH